MSSVSFTENSKFCADFGGRHVSEKRNVQLEILCDAKKWCWNPFELGILQRELPQLGSVPLLPVRKTRPEANCYPQWKSLSGRDSSENLGRNERFSQGMFCVLKMGRTSALKLLLRA